MPMIHNSHSFNLKGRITARASKIQIINVREGKKIKDAIPSERPMLNMAPLGFGRAYILNKAVSTKSKIVFTIRGAEK